MSKVPSSRAPLRRTRAIRTGDSAKSAMCGSYAGTALRPAFTRTDLGRVSQGLLISVFDERVARLGQRDDGARRLCAFHEQVVGVERPDREEADAGVREGLRQAGKNSDRVEREGAVDLQEGEAALAAKALGPGCRDAGLLAHDRNCLLYTSDAADPG